MNSVTESETVKYPRIPGEMWMLWDGNGWVKSVDDAPGGETWLVAFSKQEAVAAATHQDDVYGIYCVPVRVK